MDVRRPSTDTGTTEMPPVASLGQGNRNGGGIWRLAAIVLIVAGLAVIIAYGIRAASALGADSAIKSKQYQALFLTNGQVYFGKLSHTSSGYVKLTNIYYLQVQQTVQPTTTSSSSANNQQVSLAKLGGELHGPEDTMYVSHDQVLFWENLKSDGKVTQAINNYQSTNK